MCKGAKQETIQKSICAITEANNPHKIPENMVSQDSVNSQIEINITTLEDDESQAAENPDETSTE